MVRQVGLQSCLQPSYPKCVRGAAFFIQSSKLERAQMSINRGMVSQIVTESHNGILPNTATRTNDEYAHTVAPSQNDYVT